MTKLIAAVAASFMFAAPVAHACTGLALMAKDGSYVNGRTAEFGLELHLNAIVVPRNLTFHGTLPDGSKGMTYTSKYAFMGNNSFNAPAVVDGMNEKGLSLGMFYFPGFALYPKQTPENQAFGLSPTEFSNWLLAQFASIE